LASAKLYCAYYERSRPHLSLNKDAPISRPIASGDGRVVAIPQVAALTIVAVMQAAHFRRHHDPA
jgi:hypothetical protein